MIRNLYSNLLRSSSFDGCIVEVHHDPKNALTDAKQQLTWVQFDTMIKACQLKYEKN